MIITVVLCSCGSKIWKSTLKENAILHEVKLTGKYNLRADTIYSSEIQYIKKSWMRPHDKMALFEIHPLKLFYTPFAYKYRFSNTLPKQCPYDQCVLNYMLIKYKRNHDLNYLYRKMKANSSFMVIASQHIYRNNNVHDTIVGVYTYKCLNIEKNYLDSLVLCK